MPGTRQQRGANWRGQALSVARRYVNDVSWIFADAFSSTIRLQLIGVTGDPFITAPPGFSTSGGPTVVSAVMFDATHLDLSMSAPIDQEFFLQLPALDPGWRTTSGAYLAPGKQHFAAAAGNPPTVFFINDATLVAANAASVANAAAVTCTLPTPAKFDWATIICPAANGAPIDVDTLSGVVSVPPGNVASWRFDGIVWVVI